MSLVEYSVGDGVALVAMDDGKDSGFWKATIGRAGSMNARAGAAKTA
jgi:hypothetical protein